MGGEAGSEWMVPFVIFTNGLKTEHQNSTFDLIRN
jgi:hypothetical protein